MSAELVTNILGLQELEYNLVLAIIMNVMVVNNS